jgi:hypothetical protein
MLLALVQAGRTPRTHLSGAELDQGHELINLPLPSHLSDGESAKIDLTENPRFGMMELDRYTADWQQEILVGCDYWARADAFIAKRLSGEVERSGYALSSIYSFSMTFCPGCSLWLTQNGYQRKSTFAYHDRAVSRSRHGFCGSPMGSTRNGFILTSTCADLHRSVQVLTERS